jgi:hypothetical protein
MLEFSTNNIFINAIEVFGTLLVASIVYLIVYIIYKVFKNSKFVQKHSRSFFTSMKFNTPIRFALETCIMAFLAFML